MSKFRIWTSSRDAYHCAFRLVRILDAAGSELLIEKLRVLDIFLLYPSLLHRMSMTMQMREKFRTLEIKKPEDTFIRLPSVVTVAQDLRVYQNTALNYLIGKKVLKKKAADQGFAELDSNGIPEAIVIASDKKNLQEAYFMSFLTSEVAGLQIDGPEGLLKRAGLPRRAMAS